MDAKAGRELRGCRDSDVFFDMPSLDLLVNDPQWVLDHEDEFWRLRPQELTLRWGKAVGHPIEREPWREQIAEWAALSLAEREGHVLTHNAAEITRRKADFQARAMPHVCSFLPPGADISARVAVTAFIPPRAFAIEDIVINVAARYWKDNVTNILSCLVHELGHVGHSYCRELGGDDGLTEGDLTTMLYSLQGEGFCNYVAYLAQDEFPAPDEADFRLYEEPGMVRQQIAVYNGILAAVGKVAPDELSRLIWDKCIAGNRAFYIAGMHCCHTIVDQRGREALTRTLIDGPLAFVELYNLLAETGWEIRLPRI